jgi:D-3-phosphoglycerate dehydrogenase
LGLVGFGGIGGAVARAALGLGMRVVAFDEYLCSGSGVPEVELVASLDDLLGRADVLSLHCPLTPETRGMIGRSQLARLKPGSIVVNTARGELVDEMALAEALRDGHLAGAGLDTFAEEPLPASSPLAGLPNVVMTPHMGGSTDAALAATAATAVEHALKVLRGEPVDPVVCVNPTVLPARNSAT